VVVVGDGLTVQLDRVPLRRVLAEVARQAGLPGSGSDAAGDALVSDRFRDLPLADRIQQLLGGQPKVLVSGRAQVAPGAPARWRISEILVLSKAKPPAGDQPAGDPGLTALVDPAPRMRLQALEQWAQQRQGDAVDPLTYALVDPDVQVRALAQALWERLLAPPPPASPLSSPPGRGQGR
jgi:hypothetical protein